MRVFLFLTVFLLLSSTTRADVTYPIINYAPWLDGWEFSGFITVGPGGGELDFDVDLIDMELIVSKGLDSYTFTEDHFVSQFRSDVSSGFVGISTSTAPFTEAYLRFADPIQGITLEYWNEGFEANNFPYLSAGINFGSPSGGAVYREEFYVDFNGDFVGEIRGFLENPLIAAVPEPSSMALVLLGIIPLWRARKW
ncbi:hypothetical protein KOR42_33210 [Thalassoglobus neptunius]|uniref:PEP-CTERM protein-sorting domain-containing protein n=1 Tax=Thalassoglobus neptunius TaxID=1938619 RepID=A0A5C5WMJ5_9PLAN|nr:PEP-CTERM sorting domain-containing protein [Thalassoglobus neptunius]TWT51848.1 hypothetical protein KOR42_33210 [Thalassoglobus neptunius]